MNFITFTVGNTNIFPMANSTTGGQYATEFNLRSRESVCTPQNVTYMIGPSYVHGEADYQVTIDESSRSILRIAPGRAVINGHFVQNLAPMLIDVAAARAQEPTIVGELCIGIRAMYSTLPTMAGTIEVEDGEQMYEGVQVVVLPKSDFKLPIDVPADENQVTAHIKLAEFTYRNGQISGLINDYPAKCQSIEAIRVAGQGDNLSSKYLSKAGLNGRNLYVFAGKGTETDSNGDTYDTWCIAQDSLMVWDANTRLGTTRHDNTEEAEFVTDVVSGKVNLYIPHKQLDYNITDTHGSSLYYQPKVISLPTANFTTGTPGTVTPDFINAIKNKFTELGVYKSFPSGTQITYIDELHDRSELPLIRTEYRPGDFVLVGHDYTVSADTIAQAPTTMYVIQCGVVSEIQYIAMTDSIDSIPSECDGVKLAEATFSPEEVVTDTTPGDPNDMWGIGTSSEYRGNTYHDYLVAVVTYPADETHTDPYTKYLFYLVTSAGAYGWTDALWLTTQIPFATETAVGGFLNVPDTALDSGYVYLDNTGHLRLMDYELLRSGTLAYQLSEDVTLTGLTLEALQAELDDRVNYRVAFPSDYQMRSKLQYNLNPNMIDVTIELTDDEPGTVYLRGVDSRFGGFVNLHITGNASSTTSLVIANCEKIRIDNNIQGSPTINIINCGLYYDSVILDKVDSISGLTLWYEPINTDQPSKISVDGLTVTTRDPQVIPQEIDFWSVDDPNDNHYEYALRSITFDAFGQLIGASIMIRNNSTYNVDPGNSIYVTDFILPQGAYLTYPKSRLRKQIRIDGTFVSAYWSTHDAQYILTTTSFTAVSQTYDPIVVSNGVDWDAAMGTISLFSNTIVTSNVAGRIGNAVFTPGSDIDGWSPDSFHVFSGGIVS